jgi:hypothetical protein
MNYVRILGIAYVALFNIFSRLQNLYLHLSIFLLEFSCYMYMWKAKNSVSCNRTQLQRGRHLTVLQPGKWNRRRYDQ